VLTIKQEVIMAARGLDTNHPFFSALTPRERDVMGYVAMGKPNKIIAAELGVSQRTVEAHRARVFQKLQVRNAVELARCVMSQHLLAG
jgi:DNA-binding NarL/FixJ family response regulator